MQQSHVGLNDVRSPVPVIPRGRDLSGATCDGGVGVDLVDENRRTVVSEDQRPGVAHPIYRWPAGTVAIALRVWGLGGEVARWWRGAPGRETDAHGVPPHWDLELDSVPGHFLTLRRGLRMPRTLVRRRGWVTTTPRQGGNSDGDSDRQRSPKPEPARRRCQARSVRHRTPFRAVSWPNRNVRICRCPRSDLPLTWSCSADERMRQPACRSFRMTAGHCARDRFSAT
jgi:hypothetical protein